jgi:hypothetical protein
MTTATIDRDTAADERSRERRWLGAMVLFGALPPLALLVAEGYLFGDLRGFPLDDSWIHLQFARNLAAGEGLAYDGGRLVAGSTAPLWTLLLAPLFLLPGPVEVWTKLLGLAAQAATVGAVYVLARRLTLGRPLAALAAILVAATDYLLWASISGMEVPLFNFLALAGIAAHVGERSAELAGKARPPRSFLLLGLAALTRPEGLLLPILAALDRVVVAADSGFALSRAGARRALAGLALAAILVVPVALSYERISGSPAPTTLAAKSEGPRGWLPEGRHLQKILGFLFGSQPLPALLAAGGALAMVSRLGTPRDRGLLLPAWAVGLPLALATLSSGRELLTGNFGRYLYPLLPAAVLLGVLALDLLGADRLRSLALGRLHLPVAVPLVLLVFLLPLVPRARAAVAVFLQSRQNVEDSDVRVARWLAANVPPDALLGLCDIGVVKYRLPNPIVDLAGIASPERRDFLERMAREHGLPWPQALRLWLEQVRPEYIVVYPRWFPLLEGDPARFPALERIQIPDNVAMGGDELVVYGTPWTRERPWNLAHP